MLKAFVCAAARPCALLLTVVLLSGAVGYVGTPHLAAAGIEDLAEAPADDLQLIEAVLVHRAPELGLGLRQRVSRAISEESRKAGYDPLFILGLIQIESAFSWDAVSWAGARGLMQMQPATLEYVAGLEGVKLSTEEIYRDPALQVRLGVRYLSRLEKRFRSLDLALMAYNAGPEKLRQALEKGESERYRGYVRVVRRNHARFRRDLRLADEPALAQADAPAEL